ncbi:hypothetical protein BAL199_00295 [alpha proteobacterium BAL199]|nr:hypothetical protein BAL199_00295 [alpha proteobacterium BAL199]
MWVKARGDEAETLISLRSYSSTLPGFISPAGSIAVLIVRMRSSAAGCL